MMRWRRFEGARIPSRGVRTFIDVHPTIRFGDTTKRYGYVWSADGAFNASVERLHPGEVEDVDLGVFQTQGAARRAVIEALTDR
jgi:hypothetical protein